MRRAEDFLRDGWLAVPGLVDRRSTDAVLTALAGRHPGRWPGGRTQDAWRRDEAVRRLATHPRVAELITELLGERPIPFQTLNFVRGTGQRMHADTVHFDTLPPGRMCGVWIALEPVGEHQGPLQYVSGSHRLPPVRAVDAQDAHGCFDINRYEDLVEQQVGDLPVQQFLAQPGDAFVWHAGLVHGGGPLRPGTSRWSQVTHYFLPGSVYITPMDSRLASGEYRVRLPLVDIATGRPVPQVVEGAPARMVHLRSGRSRLLRPEDPPPPRHLAASSAARAAIRRVRWRLAPLSHRLRNVLVTRRTGSTT